MLWFKYSLMLMLFLTQVAGAKNKKFDSNSCLQAGFTAQILNSGEFFGVLKNELYMKKDVCQIEIQFKRVLETKWKIDICREPIHVKLYSKGTESVHKRVKACNGSVSTEFCEAWTNLSNKLQDYGLIYAPGERETLSSAHGQVYCSYLLLNRYLEDGYVFSKYENPLNIYGSLVDAKRRKTHQQKKEIKPSVEMTTFTKTQVKETKEPQTTQESKTEINSEVQQDSEESF